MTVQACPFLSITRTQLLWLLQCLLVCCPPSLFLAQAAGKDTPPSIQPMQQTLQLTADEKAWIRNHPGIRLGFDPHFAPFTFMDNDGRLMGISSEIVGILNTNLGLNMEAVPGLSWNEVVTGARKGSIDVLACVTATKERSTFLSFTRPYLSFTRVLITRTDMPFLTGLDDVSHMRVATRRSSSHESFLKEQANISPFLYDNIQQGLQAVSTGVSDIYVTALEPASYWIRQLQLTNLKVAASLNANIPNLHLAVRKDWPELVSILNKGLVSIDENQTAAITRNWDTVKLEPNGNVARLSTPFFGLVLGILAILLFMLVTWKMRLAKEVRKREKVIRSLHRSNDFEELITKTTSRFKAIKDTDVDTAINATLSDIAGFSQAETACVFLLSEDGESLVMSHDYHSHHVKETVQTAPQAGTQEMQWWLKRMASDPFLAIENVTTLPLEAQWERRFTCYRGVTALLDTGLHGREKLIGFISLATVRPGQSWDAHTVNLLVLAAQLFTSAIEQKRLEKLLSHSTYRDTLTGIANHQYFDEIYRKEWFRAQRDQILLSILLIDIDGFDRVNQSYGHRTGDDCLLEIAESLSACLQRSSDLIARFDNSDFAVLLINTDSRGAVQMAEAMREEIVVKGITFERAVHLKGLTISAGVATLLPERSISPGLLLEKAGKALQEAKENGGNQVIHTLR